MWFENQETWKMQMNVYDICKLCSIDFLANIIIIFSITEANLSTIQASQSAN